MSASCMGREYTCVLLSMSVTYVRMYSFQCFICRRMHTTVLECSPSHVRSLEYVEEESLLLSSSHDGCVRLWNTNGQFIGVCMHGACHQSYLLQPLSHINVLY